MEELRLRRRKHQEIKPVEKKEGAKRKEKIKKTPAPRIIFQGERGGARLNRGDCNNKELGTGKKKTVLIKGA